MRNLLVIMTLVMAWPLYAGDKSDAPSPYPPATYFQTPGGVRVDYLGNGCTDDTSAAPVPGGWTGDDCDDGVEFLNMNKGGTATIKVEVCDSYGNDDLAIWMDFNDDGDWDDAGERVIWAGKSGAAPNGPFTAKVAPPYGGNSTSFNTYSVSIPASAAGSSVKVRARLWDPVQHTSGAMAPNGGGSPSDYSEYGEVEDFDVPYGTSTGSKLVVYEMGGSTPINHGTTHNGGSMTAGVQTNLFFDIGNLRDASHFLRFTTAVGNPTITYSNNQNCTVSLFTPANGVTVYPGGLFTFIATVTVSSGSIPYSFDVSIPTNDPLVPTYTFTVNGNGAQPAPKLDLQRPAYTSHPAGSTDNIGDYTAAATGSATWYIFNLGQLTLGLTGSPLVQVGSFNNCTASVSNQPPVSSLQGGGWSMTFDVDITPTTAGSAFSFTISIQSNDPASNPYVITVTGNAVSSGGSGGGGTGGGGTGGGGTGGGGGGSGGGGTGGAPAIAIDRSGTSLPAGTTDNVGFFLSGGTTNFVYSAANNGSAPLTFTGNPHVAVSGVSNCSVSVTQQLPTGLAAGASAPFIVSVTTAGSGALGFTLTINSDDPAVGTYTLYVKGQTGTQPPVFELTAGKGKASSGCVGTEQGGRTAVLLLILFAVFVRRRSNTAPGPRAVK